MYVDPAVVLDNARLWGVLRLGGSRAAARERADDTGRGLRAAQCVRARVRMSVYVHASVFWSGSGWVQIKARGLRHNTLTSKTKLNGG